MINLMKKMKSRMGSRVLGVRSEILNKLTKSSLRRSHLSRDLEEVREMSHANF